MPSKTVGKSLADNQLFASVDPDDLKRIESRCQWWRLAAGEQIIDREGDNRDVYCVVEGSVRVVNYSSTGREVAYVVAFLASPKSVAINGDAIAAAGGSGRAIHY